jgi:hypothetical protein
VESFRTHSLASVHVELRLDGFTLGIASIEAARDHHGLRPEGDGRWIEIVLWTDDTNAAVSVYALRRDDMLFAKNSI